MKSNKFAKKLLSLIIVSTMIVSMLPISALAAESDVMIEDQAEAIVEEAADVTGEVVEEAAEVPDIEEREESVVVNESVDEIEDADSEELTGSTEILSVKAEGITSGSNMSFNAQLTGLSVSAVVPVKRAAKGSYMTADIVDVSAYEDAIAKKNYGKSIAGLYGLELHFYDKKGKEIKHINTSNITVTVDGFEASSYFIGRIDNKVNKIQRGTEPTFTFTEKKAYTYVIAGLEDDGLVRASGETDGDGNKRFNLNDENVNIEVVAPEDAFADGVAMEANDVTSGTALDAEGGDDALVGASSEEIIAAYNISFYNEDGAEQQPSKAVTVTINVPLDMTKCYELIHIADDGTRSTVEGATFTENGVEFVADSFSVYAVVEPGSTDDNARATLNFYGKNTSTPVATFYVKNADLDDDAKLSQIVYDPGVDGLLSGEIFKGWSVSSKGTTDGLNYTSSTTGKDIAAIREFLEGLTIQEGDVYNIYAMIFKAYNIKFLDEDGRAVHGETLINKANEAVSYKIVTDYTPKTENQKFEGWYATTTADDAISPPANGTTYQIGETVSIKGDVTFTPDAPIGNWLVFDNNLGTDKDTKASYTPPQFIRTGQTPIEPADPTRNGYTFEGWYDDNGDLFDFSQTIDSRTTVHAQWATVSSAPYTVIIWKQNVAIDGYDFAEAFTLNGTPDTIITTVTGSGDTATITGRPNGNTIRYTGFEFGSVDQNVNIKANGTSVINVYFNRKQYTLTFQVSKNNRWVTIKTITAYYEQDISSNFPIIGTDNINYNGYVWYAQNSSIYGSGNIWVPYIDVMREENTIFHGNRMGTYSTRYYRYYTEVLPGDSYDKQFDGKNFKLHANVGISSGYSGFFATYEEDFSTMDAFSRYKSDPVLNPGDQVEVPASGFNFYYTRNKYPITYQDGIYVNGDGFATSQESRGTLKTMPESDYIYYQASLSDKENYFTPTYDGYEFIGWYIDESCTQPFDWNSTMPKGGVKVYAKWVAVQYRIFLHANADNDQSLDWGGQKMSFRVDEGEKLANGNKIIGTRATYELVGWYFEDSFENPFNFDAYEINSGLEYLEDYDQTEPTELDKWSKPDGTTENKDKAENRIWIKKKLNLYAKWRSTMKDSKGIQVIYDAGEGTNSANSQKIFTDPLYYLDTAKAIAQPAATPTDNTVHFVDWIVQKWDGSDWVNTSVKVSPGDSFEVLKANAFKQENPQWDHETEDMQFFYSIRVVAEYGPKDTPTPTHITWYANGGNYENKIDGEKIVNGDVTLTNIKLQINESVEIPAVGTFTNTGYKFLGWARLDEPADAFNSENNTVDEDKYSVIEKPKLWLQLNDDGATYSELDDNGNVVAGKESIEYVAADEALPYHALYAVWEHKGVFYVFHSSDATVDMIDMSTLDSDTYDITAAVKENYLYGGYFHEYYNVTDEQAVAAAQAKTPVDTETYDGSALYKRDSNNKVVRYWTKSKAYTEDGSGIKLPEEIAPETDLVYYLREIPEDFLGLRVQVIFDTDKANAIDNLYLITTVDNNIYNQAGFKVVTDRKATFYASYSIQSRHSDEVTTIKADDLNGIGGYIGVWEGTKILLTDAEENSQFTVEPYWITMDGVRVDDIRDPRTFNIGNKKFDVDGGMSEVKE